MCHVNKQTSTTTEHAEDRQIHCMMRVGYTRPVLILWDMFSAPCMYVLWSLTVGENGRRLSSLTTCVQTNRDVPTYDSHGTGPSPESIKALVRGIAIANHAPRVPCVHIQRLCKCGCIFFEETCHILVCGRGCGCIVYTGITFMRLLHLAAAAEDVCG